MFHQKEFTEYKNIICQFITWYVCVWKASCLKNNMDTKIILGIFYFLINIILLNVCWHKLYVCFNLKLRKLTFVNFIYIGGYMKEMNEKMKQSELSGEQIENNSFTSYMKRNFSMLWNVKKWISTKKNKLL